MDYITNKGIVMKRTAVFAHYSKDFVIDDYVLYYLKELKKICCNLVFVSCTELPESEKQKLSGVADVVIAYEHNEYDFGSYKRGFQYLKDNSFLKDIDELVFANDSCYGPFLPLENIFSEMEGKGADFWGITKNNFGYREKPGHIFVKRPHIQSYFIVFNKNVFMSEIFIRFILSIQAQADKKQVISKYEIGLTEILVDNGFKYDVFVNAYGNINNVTILKWRQIIEKCRMPFMKKSLIELRNTDATTIEDFRGVISKISSYPINLFILPREIKRKAPVKVKRFIFDTLANFPFLVRKPFAILINKLFVFLKD